MIKSKVSLDKKYKTKVKLDDPVIKQMQLLLEQLEYDDETDNFFMKYYAGPLKSIYDADMIEPFTYYILSSVELKKNSKICQ